MYCIQRTTQNLASKNCQMDRIQIHLRLFCFSSVSLVVFRMCWKLNFEVIWCKLHAKFFLKKIENRLIILPRNWVSCTVSWKPLRSKETDEKCKLIYERFTEFLRIFAGTSKTSWKVASLWWPSHHTIISKLIFPLKIGWIPLPLPLKLLNKLEDWKKTDTS